jgi:hypothetical protein
MEREREKTARTSGDGFRTRETQPWFVEIEDPKGTRFGRTFIPPVPSLLPLLVLGSVVFLFLNCACGTHHNFTL